MDKKKIEINNSYEAAVKSGRWGNPGASLYNKIKYSKTLLKEAYLQVGDVDKDTSFSSSGCKYPHHTVINGELVVSIPGIKAALSRAKQMGVCHGELKKHLERHYREMGIYKDSALYKESVIDENFKFIDEYLGINQNELMKEEAIQESTVKEYDMFEDYFIPRGITTPEKLLEFMNGIEYDDDDKHWKLRDPYKNNHKYGNCHDQSLLEKVWFEHFDYECGQLFFIEYRDGEDVGGRTHTLTWFNDVDGYHWFENAWYDNRGIHGPFNSLKELKDFVRSKWEETNDTFPEDKKYTGIEFYDKPNYKVGMNLEAYVDSWTGNFNEQANWIDRIVHNELFRESVFEEAHNYKKEFRYVIDETNGHFIKVVYEMDPKNVVGFGGNILPDDEALQNMRTHGHTNYVSKGNKVVALIDMCNNKKLQSVSAFPPIHNVGGNLAPITVQKYLSTMKRFTDEKKLAEIEKKLKAECPTGIAPSLEFPPAIEKSKERGQQPITYTVGEIDNTETFKTTNPVGTIKSMFGQIANVKKESVDDILNTDIDEEIDEKSHGRLNFSFRMGIDVETGHLVKIVFDLNKEDVTGFGSHDSTHVIPEDQWDYLQKHIRSKGHNDFTSVATVKAIVDLDTNKRLDSVRAVGAMSGLQSFGNKPLKEREKLVADGAMFGGARTFTVGEKEPLKRFMPDGTYKTTTPAKSIKELEKIVNPHLHKESAIYTEADNDVTSRIKANVADPEEEKEEDEPVEEIPEEEPTEEPTEETPTEEPADTNEEEETPSEETPEETPEETKEEEPPKEEVSEEPPALDETPTEETKEEKPQSLPKQADKEEANKNGVNRKKLYIAFIEHAKGINNKNVFGSIFDKDAFHVTYPYVPHELRYFYRLANPTLCVMENDFTFFAVSELKKINKDNKEFPKKLVFAAKPDLLYVFNNDDKHVYTATEGDNALTLKDEVAKTFDLFIQDIVGQGDILNSPPDIEGAVMKDDGSNK